MHSLAAPERRGGHAEEKAVAAEARGSSRLRGSCSAMASPSASGNYSHPSALSLVDAGGRLCLRNGCLRGGAHVRGSGFLENALGRIRRMAVVDVNRDEDIAASDLSLVSLGFDLGNSKP